MSIEERELLRRPSRKASKFDRILSSHVDGKRLKNSSWELENIKMFDFYRFFKRNGKTIHSVVRMDKDWGAFFIEAVILYRDFVIAVERQNIMSKEFICTIYHRSEKKAEALWDSIDELIKVNGIFRGEQFVFPSLNKPKMAKGSFINDFSKELIEENTIEFFRSLQKRKNLGLKTKRGIILHGNPGNGKTSICRWISSNLPDVTRIWATDWMMDPDCLPALFSMARYLSPSVIFLEDIDTIGVSRHMSRMNGVLGKLLSEMDGIEKNEDVIVIATTNNMGVLDEALANRPGRFDLKIHVGNPRPDIVKAITGHEDNISLAEAFRRKEDKIYYEKILGKKYKPPESGDDEDADYFG